MVRVPQHRTDERRIEGSAGSVTTKTGEAVHDGDTDRPRSVEQFRCARNDLVVLHRGREIRNGGEVPDHAALHLHRHDGRTLWADTEGLSHLMATGAQGPPQPRRNGNGEPA